MSGRSATVLAWSLFAAFVVLVLATLGLLVAGRGGDEYLSAFALGYPLVGALVASRQPANPVGWLLLAIGLGLALGALVDTNLASASPPAFALSAWLSETAWYVWLISAGVFLPLVFPNGRLVSPRWRPVVWLGIAALVASLVGVGFEPGPLDVDSPQQLDNPLGIEAAAGFLSVLARVGDGLAAASFLLAAASLVVRFRRSRGTERQQLKWFAYVGLVALAGLAVAMVQVLFGAQEGEEISSWVDVLGAVGWLTALGTIVIGIPIATGIAILRHRLYDIDVVIRRTLVYGALTATLVASYVGSVLLLQLVLSPGVRHRHRRVHFGGGGAVQARRVEDPAARRPALLPAQVRRRPDDRGVQRPAARRGRARHAELGPERCRAPDDAAGTRLAVAARPRGAAVSARRLAWLAPVLSLAFGAITHPPGSPRLPRRGCRWRIGWTCRTCSSRWASWPTRRSVP